MQAMDERTKTVFMRALNARCLRSFRQMSCFWGRECMCVLPWTSWSVKNRNIDGELMSLSREIELHRDADSRRTCMYLVSFWFEFTTWRSWAEWNYPKTQDWRTYTLEGKSPVTHTVALMTSPRASLRSCVSETGITTEDFPDQRGVIETMTLLSLPHSYGSSSTYLTYCLHIPSRK